MNPAQSEDEETFKNHQKIDLAMKNDSMRNETNDLKHKETSNHREKIKK